MFSKGDIIVYGNTGVCRVEEVGPLSISAAKKDTIYYRLLPYYGGGVIYTPVSYTHLRLLSLPVHWDSLLDRQCDRLDLCRSFCFCHQQADCIQEQIL